MTPALRRAPRIARAVLRTYGPKGIARRARYEVERRSGYLERALPLREELPPALDGWTWPLRFDLDEIRTGYERLDDLDDIRHQVLEEAERVLAGWMRFYGWAWKEVGWPPRWHTNPWTGHTYPEVHWSRISDDVPAIGDIKDVWEISRWPFTYLFARAWVLTGDDRYPDAWWEAVEDWIERTPPNLGVNWRCAQETSLRGIALQFGLTTFGDHPSTTPERIELAGRLLRTSVERVVPTLHYALSQRNNHAISEAVFLETCAVAGVADDEVGRVGRRAVREAVADQFYPDGWYAQHSLNYQRLALHTLTWLNRVRGLAGLGPADETRGAIGRSAELLYAAHDPVSGWAPNLGANDGALLFPLTTSAHRDLRPLLTTLRAGRGPGTETENHRAAEESLWLGTVTTGTDRDIDAADRHLVVLGGPRTHAVVCSGRSRHRASHDDLLHLDLWIDGVNVLADPGTYRYTAPSPWNNALSDRRVHNVPYLPGTGDERLGRFLRITRTHGEILRHETTANGLGVLKLRRVAEQGELRRTILRRDDTYVVVDDADGAPFATRWTFGIEAEVSPGVDGATEVTAGRLRGVLWGVITSLSADPDDPLGAWIAPNYSRREPTTALRVDSTAPPTVAVFAPLGTSIPELDVEGIAARTAHPERWLIEPT
jgi:hypothetical protein